MSVHPDLTYVYRGHLSRVIDGDTVDLTLELGFHLTALQRVRLLGVDTPERGKPGFEAAREYTREFCLGQPLVVQTIKTDSFGRYLATIWRESYQESLNEALLRLQLADPYVR